MLINLQGEYAIIYNEKLWGENTICCADVLCEYNKIGRASCRERV